MLLSYSCKTGRKYKKSTLPSKKVKVFLKKLCLCPLSFDFLSNVGFRMESPISQRPDRTLRRFASNYIKLLLNGSSGPLVYCHLNLYFGSVSKRLIQYYQNTSLDAQIISYETVTHCKKIIPEWLP